MKENFSELDKKIREEDRALNAIQGELYKHISEGILPHQCEHTPDMLTPIETMYKHDQLIQVLQCKCGMTVKEYFTLSHTNVCE